MTDALIYQLAMELFPAAAPEPGGDPEPDTGLAVQLAPEPACWKCGAQGPRLVWWWAAGQCCFYCGAGDTRPIPARQWREPLPDNRMLYPFQWALEQRLARGVK